MIIIPEKYLYFINKLLMYNYFKNNNVLLYYFVSYQFDFISLIS